MITEEEKDKFAIDFANWLVTLTPSQKVSVWSKNGEHSGLFTMDNEQLLEKYKRTLKKEVVEIETETWEEIQTDIDFSKHTPTETGSSLHVYEERYEIDGKKYRLFFAIGSDSEPLIEFMVNK